MATAKKATAKKAAAETTTAPAKKSAAKKSAAKKAGSAPAPTAKKAVAKKAGASRGGGQLDAVRLLTGDHREVRELFQAYEKLVDRDADAAERKELAEQICRLLTVHATIEEEIFYPATREALPKRDDLLDEAEVEHASAKDLIAQIRGMQPDDALYDAKVTVLGEYIEHHVQEEETEMFPRCRRAKMDLQALGERLSVRKNLLTATAL